MDKLEQLLKHHYGFDSFRHGQRELVEAILQGRDVVGILPTGGGKSICYQIPAMIFPSLTLVVSPLISLMKDQVDALKQMDVSAERIDSNLTASQYFNIVEKIKNNQIRLLYVAPERMNNEGFLSLLAKISIDFVAIDEAHCVSQWGHDFRPSYRLIAQAIKCLPQRPVIAAFTATATEQVKFDIIEQLELKTPFVQINGFDRPNLYFKVIHSANRKDELLSLVNQYESTIIYCSTRKNVEKVHKMIIDAGIAATYYHAGLTTEEREINQDAFIYDKVSVIIATNAFGMGIDKPDVRQVIHYNMPKNIESYYQEAGRAGRDGLPANAVLFFSLQDVMINLLLIQNSNEPQVKNKLDAMIGYAYTGTCLRRYLLAYFGESALVESCGNCAICNGSIEVSDITILAQQLLSCVARMGQRYGTSLIIEVLRGSKNQRVLQEGFHKLSTFGLMKSISASHIRDIMTLLICEGYLQVVGKDYPIVKLTKKSLLLLKGQTTISMNKPKRSCKKKIYQDMPVEYDKSLFDQLKSIRLHMAQNLGVPPYVIFSDRTIIEMAAYHPKNENELKNLYGIGDAKAKKYGVPFLSAIRAHYKK